MGLWGFVWSFLHDYIGERFQCRILKENSHQSYLRETWSHSITTLVQSMRNIIFKKRYKQEIGELKRSSPLISAIDRSIKRDLTWRGSAFSSEKSWKWEGIVQFQFPVVKISRSMIVMGSETGRGLNQNKWKDGTHLWNLRCQFHQINVFDPKFSTSDPFM